MQNVFQINVKKIKKKKKSKKKWKEKHVIIYCVNEVYGLHIFVYTPYTSYIYHTRVDRKNKKKKEIKKNT